MKHIRLKAEKFRPSNGTEGDSFTAKFCANCGCDVVMNGKKTIDEALDGELCPILGETMMYTVESGDYPEAWIEDEEGARCTAFSPMLGTAVRDEMTRDMFKEGDACHKQPAN